LRGKANEMADLTTLQELIAGLTARGAHAAVLSVADDGSTQTLSYAVLGDTAHRLATGLLRAGLKPGDPVVLFGPNSADWITVRLAVAATGAVAVALDDLSTDAELAVLVPDSGARFIFAASPHVPRLRALPQADTRAIYTLDDRETDGAGYWRSLVADQADALPAVAADADCMLVFTSGTTGTPKSFVLTHANLVANINGLLAERLVGPDDRALLPLPLHHVYPLTVGCLTALASGTTIVLPAGVTGPQIVGALKAGRVTLIVGVPRLYAALVAGLEARVKARGGLAQTLFTALFNLSFALRRRFGLRVGRVLFRSLHRQLAPELWLMASGGARFEAELIWKLEALGWEVLSGYGLAETASILTANRRGRARIGSEGPPLPGAELRLASRNEQGEGEIETRGPSVFAGYRNNAEANAAAFTEDGWFRTGDLGTIDADAYVTITGRLKEMIVLGGGKNVYPEEVEKIYADNPSIRELAVLEQAGALVAVVLPHFDAIAATGNRRVEDVIRIALAERSRLLPSFQRIAGFAIVREPLPRTRLGKYQRFLLPGLYARAKAGAAPAARSELSAADRALLAESPAREIWAWLAARYPDKRLAPDLSPQLDLGIDSLEWVTITLELAEQFGIQLTEQDAADALTLRDLLLRASARGRQETPVAKVPALTDEQLGWLAPPDRRERIAGHILRVVNVALMRGAFRLRVAGLDNVPVRGPYVLVCNHLSDLDPLVVAAALGRARLEDVWWSGDVGRLFESAAGRALARIAHIFPVDERKPATAIAFGAEVLRRGRALIWFPESWRSPDGELQEFLNGIGHLLQRTPVPVVPARIVGTFEAMPRSRRLPRPAAVRITFGAPVDPRTLPLDQGPAPIAARLRAAVAALPR
jgi:long-chain acyl-CoA synthetase